MVELPHAFRDWEYVKKLISFSKVAPLTVVALLLSPCDRYLPTAKSEKPTLAVIIRRTWRFLPSVSVIS